MSWGYFWYLCVVFLLNIGVGALIYGLNVVTTEFIKGLRNKGVAAALAFVWLGVLLCITAMGWHMSDFLLFKWFGVVYLGG